MTDIPLRPGILLGRRSRVRAAALPAASTPRERPKVAALTYVERSVAFFVPLAVCLVVAYDLVIVHHSQIGDTYSRMANGYYVFFGKDPHLAAIGFVWQPLQSMIDMPLMFLRGLWPDLTRLSFSADIASSFCLAGASYQVYRFFEELGLSRAARWLLLLGLVANPMILYYGSNGMSEALFIFTLAATTRYLVRWLETGATRPLLISAVWLGLAYADRNEAAMAALVGTVVVAAVTYRRTPGYTTVRRSAAFLDAVLFCAPFALVFVGWAITSYVIVGAPFEQFSSIYGNSSQLATLASLGSDAAAHAGALANLTGALRVTLYFAPVYPLAVVAAAARAWRSRDAAVLGVLAIFGGVVVFELGTYSVGQLAEQDRYFIYVIPMAVLCLGCLARPLRKSKAERRNERALLGGGTPRHLTARRRQRRQRHLLSGLLAAAAVVTLVPGMFTTWHEMFHTTFGLEERDQLEFVLHPGSAAARRDPYRTEYDGILRAASYLDSLHAGRGQLMIDNFDQCVPAIILASDNPDQFEIPNDVNYNDLFGVPYQFGVRYMMVPRPVGTGTQINSINRNYPQLYATGEVDSRPFGKLVKQLWLPVCGTYRLYKLLPGGSSLG